MKKTVITTFAAVAALSAGLVAAKGAHEPSWHTQDHGEIPGLQAAPKDNAVPAEKSADSVKLVAPAPPTQTHSVKPNVPPASTEVR